MRDEVARAPTEDELRAYLRAWTPSRIEGLRAEAADILGSFSRDVVEAAAPRIRDEAVAGEIRSSLSQFEAAARPTFEKIGGNILLSMAGALFYTLLLFLVLLALRAAGVDILTVANSVEQILPARPGSEM